MDNLVSQGKNQTSTRRVGKMKSFRKQNVVRIFVTAEDFSISIIYKRYGENPLKNVVYVCFTKAHRYRRKEFINLVAVSENINCFFLLITF